MTGMDNPHLSLAQVLLFKNKDIVTTEMQNYCKITLYSFEESNFSLLLTTILLTNSCEKKDYCQ